MPLNRYIVPGLYGVLKICETATFSIGSDGIFKVIEVDSLLYILGKVISIVNNGKSNVITEGSSSSSDSSVMEEWKIWNGYWRITRIRG
jgi:hypothetical protein